MNFIRFRKKAVVNIILSSLFLSAILMTSAWASEGDHHSHTDNSSMKDMTSMNMKSMLMTGDSNKAAQGGSAPANARDPHANSGGYKRNSLRKLTLADEYMFSSLRVDRLEAATTDGNTSGVYDLQAWYGLDYDRLVIKAEGDFNLNELEESSTELLWGHALATFWNSQLGLKYNNSNNTDRTWLAVGIQGLAPYWFEIDTTLYVDENGQSEISFEAEYELLITQKWIVQPRIESTIYGKDETEKGIGAGFSDISLGLRLRYEIIREVAPYIGFEWSGKMGNTANIAKKTGQPTSDSKLLAGVRFWF